MLQARHGPAIPTDASTFRTRGCFASEQLPTAPMPHELAPATYRTALEAAATSRLPLATACLRSGLGRRSRSVGSDCRQPLLAKAPTRIGPRDDQGSAKATPWQSQGPPGRGQRAVRARCHGSPGPVGRTRHSSCTGGDRGAYGRRLAPRGIPARAIRQRDCIGPIVTDPRHPMNGYQQHHQPRVRRPLTRADVMTAAEVASLLALPKSTVYELARRGDLPCARLGRAVRFVRDDVEARLRG